MHRNSTLLSYYSIELARAFRSLVSPWLRFLSSRPQRLPRVEVVSRCIKIRVAYISGAAPLPMRRCERWHRKRAARFNAIYIFFPRKGIPPTASPIELSRPRFANFSTSPEYASSCLTFFESLVCLLRSPWHRLRRVVHFFD